MTTIAPDILLLAEEPLARRLSPPVPEETIDLRSDPFAALEQLARRRYRVILVAAPQSGYPNLLEAIRRLQPSARIFGLCSPANEPELHRTAIRDGELLEDYFIVPPTSKEWRQILDADMAREAGTSLPAAQTHVPVGNLSELINSSQSVDELSSCVARLVRGVCGVEVKWARLDEGRRGVQQLLVLDDDPPRVLWAAEPLVPDEKVSLWLSSLRGVLPALAGAARRAGLLRHMVITDELTGAYSRRYFMHFGQQLLERAAQNKFRVTLLLYDIDDFKRYNDEFGHAAGDEILRETAKLMKQITRAHDVVARIGGDEFAVLFWDAGPTRQPNSQPPQSAFALADRFRKAVNTLQFRLLGPKAAGTLSISGGLASFPWDGRTIDQLLAQADAALLSAKASGKNNIFIAGESTQIE